jgi:anti-sigma B factor antagonist
MRWASMRWAARGVADDGRRVSGEPTIPSRTNTNRSSPKATPFGIVQRKLDARTSLVTVEGELDLFTAPNLKRTLVDALQTGSRRFVLDLSLTTFIDSTTLGVLVGITRRLEDGAWLGIVCTRPNVRKIFEFSGLDGTFTIFPTLDEALAHARGNEACAS